MDSIPIYILIYIRKTKNNLHHCKIKSNKKKLFNQQGNHNFCEHFQLIATREHLASQDTVISLDNVDFNTAQVTIPMRLKSNL